MLNKKFLTKLLNEDFRKKVLLKNHKFVESQSLKLKQYATYVVDKHNKERKQELKESKAAKYGFCPVDIIAYCAKDGSVKKSLFEFNSINHFLVKGDHDAAVEVATCIISELVSESKKDVVCFDIDKIDSDMKKCEEEYLKAQEELKKLKEQAEAESNSSQCTNEKQTT